MGEQLAGFVGYKSFQVGVRGVSFSIVSRKRKSGIYCYLEKRRAYRMHSVYLGRADKLTDRRVRQEALAMGTRLGLF